MQTVTEDTTRAPIPSKGNGWHTYDFALKLTHRADVRTCTYFAPDDAAAIAYADRISREWAEPCGSRGKTARIVSLVVTRRVGA
jgi:hypothetical protein